LNNKVVDYIFIAMGVLLFIIGQSQILFGGSVIAGIIFIMFSVILFFLGLFKKGSPVFYYISKLFEHIKIGISSFDKTDNKDKPVGARVEKEDEKKLGIPVPAQMRQPFKFEIPQMPPQLSFNFFIPKLIFMLVAVLAFVIAQIFFFKGDMKMTFILLATFIILGIVFFSIKEKGIRFELRLETGLKLLLIVSGFVLICIGWILLLNRSISQQEIGVFFTVAGVIAAFIGLPSSNIMGDKNAEPGAYESVPQEPQTQPACEETDILFLKPEFLNNYVFKVSMFVLALIMVFIGNKFLNNPDTSMNSVFLYAGAGVLVFFALPLMNYRTKTYSNKIIDIIKLIAVIAAVFIAYSGQQMFIQNRIVDALKLYFIAAFIFIVAMPVQLKKDVEEKDDLPRYVEIICFLIIMAITIYFRTHELGTRPLGMENDEAGGFTGHVMGPDRNVGNFGIYFHIVHLAMTFIGDPRIALKFMGVSVGILSVPALYFLMRTAFNPRVAIFAATVFATLRWNVHYGRFGHGAIFTPITEVFAIYFFLKAFETRNKFIWFMAGLGFGMAWHGVMTTWLIIIPIFLYLFMKCIEKKGFFKANIIGIFAFLLGFWIFGSMIIHNYFISDRIYFSRINEVSVFSKDPNAPSKNVGKGIMENAKVVMLMFNHNGDGRQRNSGGQPYEPTIDQWTAVLFGLGFLYCIYYSKYYIFFIMVMIFFSQAAGSIFSIEAPSAMRAIGTMIPVIYFVGLTFDKIWLAFRRVFGKKWEFILLPILLILPLAPIVKENYHQYFERWVGGMDELATATGMYSAKLGKSYRVFLYTGMYYPGHPPFMMYRQNYKVNSSSRLVYAFNDMTLIDDENYAILFHSDNWDITTDFLNTYFPESKMESVTHKMLNPKLKDGEGFGEIARAVLISKDDIKKKRGLYASYSFGDKRLNTLPVFDKSDESKIPYSVAWNGTLVMPVSGDARIYNKAKTGFTLYIDGQKIADNQPIMLGDGLHRISIKSSCVSKNDKLDLVFDTTDRLGKTIKGRNTAPLDQKFLYNLPVYGLHGYYYIGENWDKSPVDMEFINETMWTNGGVHTPTIKFSGSLNIAVPGQYRFNTANTGYLRIVIDGRYFWESGSVPQEAVDYFKNSGQQRVAGFDLSKGRHRINIYTNKAYTINFKWSVDNKNFEPVPISALEPDFNISKN
jgi:hypothetical protein